MKFSRRLLLWALLVGGLPVAWWSYGRIAGYLDRLQVDRENQMALSEALTVDSLSNQISRSIDQSVLEPILPETAYLKVPFFCQSPFPTEASWDVHHASCEEAAALQAVFYHRGITDVDLQEVDRLLREMVSWQVRHFGVHKDIHADTLKMHLMGFFDFADEEIVVLRKASILDIKKWVAKGHPVIAPTYGRMLGNPYYQRPGPEYHMVTVVGYTRERLITNDVGTKRGKDFSYPLDVFKKSMDREGADCLVIVPKAGVVRKP